MNRTHDHDEGLLEGYEAARRDAIDKMREIASELSSVGDHNATEVARGVIFAIEGARLEGQHPRPPLPAPDPAFPSELSEDHLHARRDAIGRMREIASKLIDVRDHNAAESVYASIRFVAQPTLPPLRR